MRDDPSSEHGEWSDDAFSQSGSDGLPWGPHSDNPSPRHNTALVPQLFAVPTAAVMAIVSEAAVGASAVQSRHRSASLTAGAVLPLTSQSGNAGRAAPQWDADRHRSSSVADTEAVGAGRGFTFGALLSMSRESDPLLPPAGKTEPIPGSKRRSASQSGGRGVGIKDPGIIMPLRQSAPSRPSPPRQPDHPAGGKARPPGALRPAPRNESSASQDVPSFARPLHPARPAAPVLAPGPPTSEPIRISNPMISNP